MTHFAMICSPYPSHVGAFEALGGALAARGHRVTLVVGEGSGAAVTARGVEMRIVHFAAAPRTAGRLANGPLAILRTVGRGARFTEALCEVLPALLREIAADAVLADQMEPAGGLVASYLGLPFLSVACALPVERDPGVPPPFLDWPFDTSVEGCKRNRGAERVTRLLLSRQRRAIREQSERFGLAGFAELQDCLSPLGTLSQTVAGFDFPRPEGGRLHPMGPFRAGEEKAETLPFAPDPARPLVFASLGTLQGHRIGLFRTIAAACRRLGAQLVLAHCGGLAPDQAARIEADLVTDFLPQRAVLSHAAVCITHAGLNTAMDALEAGVPMLAIPIAFDQPGVAARIVHYGVGLKLSRRSLEERAVHDAVQRLLAEDGFRRRARALGQEVREAGGAPRASMMAERLLSRGRP
ncbi:glycosyltransferase [Aureimonas populi]|uniref:Glycosyltransferase n=1 Tax=Aureimonas populi TaxID=1701758 RepID=A0ABW5CNF0_9HYPH|nr:glycosyltransferase [Aureimonas populi]